MTTPFLDTTDLAELVDFDEDEQPQSDLSATVQPDPDTKIEFHVQMKSWTIRDMEDMIVEASARQIVGKIDRPTDMAKQIEARVRALLIEKADKRLAEVTAEIIDQPVTPSYGDKKPVTMREMIGLYGREYLTQMVGNDGQPSTGSYYSGTKTRMAYLVEKAMDANFKNEITAANNAAIAEIQNMIRKQHGQMVASEKARIRAAIEKEV